MEDHVLDKEKQTSKQKAEPPKMYSVFVMNDDFSEWPFVVETIIKHFNQTEGKLIALQRMYIQKEKDSAARIQRTLPKLKHK